MLAKLAVDPVAQIRPARRIGASGETLHRLLFSADQIVRSGWPGGRTSNHSRQKLRQQLGAGSVGLFRVGSGELVGEGIEFGNLDPRSLCKDAEKGLVECQPAGVGELDSPADAAFGQPRQRLGVRSSELGAVLREQLQHHRPR